jgi:hypothetical protein
LLGGPFEQAQIRDGRQIDKGATDGGDGDGVAMRSVARVQHGSVQRYPIGTSAAARCYHVDPATGRRQQIPQCRGTPMAEDRSIAAGQYGRDPMAVAGKTRVTDRVHATMQDVEATHRQPVIDGARVEADSKQLPSCHHPVLVPRQLCDLIIHPLFAPYTGVNNDRVGHGPRVRGRSRATQGAPVM